MILVLLSMLLFLGETPPPQIGAFIATAATGAAKPIHHGGRCRHRARRQRQTATWEKGRNLCLRPVSLALAIPRPVVVQTPSACQVHAPIALARPTYEDHSLPTAKTTIMHPLAAWSPRAACLPCHSSVAERSAIEAGPIRRNIRYLATASPTQASDAESPQS